jgi:hypothetical protein
MEKRRRRERTRESMKMGRKKKREMVRGNRRE